MDLNAPKVFEWSIGHVSLREKGVDLNLDKNATTESQRVSLREKGVDLNSPNEIKAEVKIQSPFVRREWI